MKKDKTISQENALKLISGSKDLELLISYCHLTDPLRETAAKRLKEVLPSVLEEIDDMEYLWGLFDTPCWIYDSLIRVILDRMDAFYSQFSSIEAFMTLHKKFLSERDVVFYEPLEGRDLSDLRKHTARSIREHGREKDFSLIMGLWLPCRWAEFEEFVAGAIAAETDLVLLNEQYCLSWERYGAYGTLGGVHDKTCVMLGRRIQERRAEMKGNNELIPHTVVQ